MLAMLGETMKKVRKRRKRTGRKRENDKKIKGAKKLKEGRKRIRGKTESVKISSKEISSSRMSNLVTACKLRRKSKKTNNI
jgi:hypothetical protein